MTERNEKTRTQLREIRRHLETHGSIDKPTALRICECERLGARIWDLRHDSIDPMEIETEYHYTENRFGHLVRFAVYHNMNYLR